MSDDILTDEQRASLEPVMEAALAWVVADEKADIVHAHRRLAITVALALAEARRDGYYAGEAAMLRSLFCRRHFGRYAGVEMPLLFCRHDGCVDTRTVAEEHPEPDPKAECTQLREALGE